MLKNIHRKFYIWLKRDYRAMDVVHSNLTDMILHKNYILKMYHVIFRIYFTDPSSHGPIYLSSGGSYSAQFTNMNIPIETYEIDFGNLRFRFQFNNGVKSIEFITPDKSIISIYTEDNMLKFPSIDIEYEYYRTMSVMTTIIQEAAYKEAKLEKSNGGT